MDLLSHPSKGVRVHFRFRFISSLLPFSLFLIFLSSLQSTSHALPIPTQELGCSRNLPPCSDNCLAQLVVGKEISKQATEYYLRAVRRCLEGFHGKDVELRLRLVTSSRAIFCSLENMEAHRSSDREGEYGSDEIESQTTLPTKATDPARLRKRSTMPNPSEPVDNTNTISMTSTLSSTVPTAASSNSLPAVDKTPSSNFSSGKIAGVVVGSVVGAITALSILILFLRCRRRRSPKKDRHNKTKSLEFLTSNLENAQNPWIQYSNCRVTTTTVEGNRKDGTPRSMQSKRLSGVGQAVRKVRDSLTSILPGHHHFKTEGKALDASKPSSTVGPHGLRRGKPSSWAQGSLNGGNRIFPVDYIAKDLGIHQDSDTSPIETLSSVDELIGVAVTKTKTPSLPRSHQDSFHSLEKTLHTSFSSTTTSSSSPKLTGKSGLPTSLPVTSPTPLQVPIPPPAAMQAPSTRRRNPPPAPIQTMPMPIPSATATATAQLASYAILHQSLVRESSPDISPASTTSSSCCEFQTDWEPGTPNTPNHICATGHSSCIWSCSSSASSSPRAQGSGASPLAANSSEYPFGNGNTIANTDSTISLSLPDHKNEPKPRRLMQQLQSAEGELPPSPRRLPEEVAAIMRREQQDELLRKFYGEVASANSQMSLNLHGRKSSVSSVQTSATIRAADAVYAKYRQEQGRGRKMSVGSMRSMRSRGSESNIQYGVYGSSWPERI